MKKVTMTTTTQQHCFFIVETRWPESRVDMVHVSSAGLNSGDVTPLGVHQLCLLGDHVRDNNLLPPFAMFLEKQLCRPQQGTLAGAAEEWTGARIGTSLSHPRSLGTWEPWILCT